MSDNFESKFTGDDSYEDELQDNIEKEIAQARLDREKELNSHKIVITDLRDVSLEKRFDKASIYKVFNRKQKTETFVNGEQAENLIKYTDEYVIRFDHRAE
jgi:hypothetical protein